MRFAAPRGPRAQQRNVPSVTGAPFMDLRKSGAATSSERLVSVDSSSRCTSAYTQGRGIRALFFTRRCTKLRGYAGLCSEKFGLTSERQSRTASSDPAAPRPVHTLHTARPCDSAAGVGGRRGVGRRSEDSPFPKAFKTQSQEVRASAAAPASTQTTAAARRGSRV